MLRMFLKETKPDKDSAVQESILLHCKISALNTILSLPLKKSCHGNLANKNHAIKEKMSGIKLKVCVGYHYQLTLITIFKEDR
jgi:hypothetical protein